MPLYKKRNKTGRVLKPTINDLCARSSTPDSLFTSIALFLQSVPAITQLNHEQENIADCFSFSGFLHWGTNGEASADTQEGNGKLI